jgi:hypothetical protein
MESSIPTDNTPCTITSECDNTTRKTHEYIQKCIDEIKSKILHAKETKKEYCFNFEINLLDLMPFKNEDRQNIIRKYFVNREFNPDIKDNYDSENSYFIVSSIIQYLKSIDCVTVTHNDFVIYKEDSYIDLTMLHPMCMYFTPRKINFKSFKTHSDLMSFYEPLTGMEVQYSLQLKQVITIGIV